MTNHTKGRYCLQWPTGRSTEIPGCRNGAVQTVPQMHMAVYQVTGIYNDVFVQSSETGKSQWMVRSEFEKWVSQIIHARDGVETKPTSKGWKPISLSPGQSALAFNAI